MTELGTFIQDSAYPGKKLSVDQNQLYIEDNGPITIGRIRELDTVGQIQWVSEDMRQLAYALEKPVAQPAAQPPAPQPSEPPTKSSSSVFVTIIAIVAILAVCAAAYFFFTSMSADDNPTDPPAATEPATPEPEPEPDPPTPPSDETT